MSTLACSILRRTPCGSASSDKTSWCRSKIFVKDLQGLRLCRRPPIHIFLKSIFFPSTPKTSPRAPFFRFWCQLGSILTPNLDPKSLQNRSKSHPKSNQNHISCFIVFFLIDFWLIFCWFSTSKSTKNQQKNDQQITPTPQQQKIKKVDFVLYFTIQSCPRLCYVVCKNH